KYNHGFRRFHLKSNRKVEIEFGLVALAHNIRKYISLLDCRNEKHAEKKPIKCAFAA
ncbi:MAG: transposase, partial [Bacteroidales bacterium]|nr:transposase [Bacteroidales bacterium]